MAQGSRRECTLVTLADVGLRPGEALALRWKDFDEVTRVLNVERAVSDREVKPAKLDPAGQSRLGRASRRTSRPNRKSWAPNRVLQR
jgi:integrase